MFSTNELIWAVINFLIFFAIVRLVFFKPVLKTLDERRAEVRENLSRAETARKEAEELRVKYEEQVGAARREAQELLNKAARSAEETRQEIVDRADAEAQRMLEKAREAIRHEKEKALDALRNEVADLAVLAAGKVVGKALEPKDHRRLVDEFVDEVEEIQ